VSRVGALSCLLLLLASLDVEDIWPSCAMPVLFKANLVVGVLLRVNGSLAGFSTATDLLMWGVGVVL
jgi:hypothetical protein